MGPVRFFDSTQTVYHTTIGWNDRYLGGWNDQYLGSSKKEKKVSKKIYKVIKEHPLWEVGAIVSNGNNADCYQPISDLYVKDLAGPNVPNENWYESASLVENQPEWFERVYEVSALGKVKYLAKDAAREALEKLHK